jgi:hypothetical protein
MGLDDGRAADEMGGRARKHDFVIVVIARDPRSAMPSLLKSAVVQETSEDRVPAV